MASLDAVQRNFRFQPHPPSPLNAAMGAPLVLIRSTPLFADLPESVTVELASSARSRTFVEDAPLFLQGQPVIALILLQSGCVKHTQVGPNGTEVLIRFSVDGDIVDIRAESPGLRHSCSARATENCRALIWDYRRIEALASCYPQLGENISHLLRQHLEDLEVRFCEMATEKVRERLSLVLARLLQQIGKPSQSGIQISIRREELAQMTGSTIFTISRVLSGWSEEGFVVPHRESVVIRDPEKLIRNDTPRLRRIAPRNADGNL